MCWLATLHYSCKCSTLFQMHCQHDEAAQSQICEPPNRTVLASYYALARCEHHHAQHWDRADDVRLALIDDRLAELARRSAAGQLTRAQRVAFARHVSAIDLELECRARALRARDHAEVISARNWARRHAMALWRWTMHKSMSPGYERLRGVDKGNARGDADV
ncbi:hypothetical protein B0H67DRAFT_552121 [Lasiosphaeris hirsuta]|uniref:Uncharacterized protein n=1 Tax=Lasiosphaeris hirsuta TaxID=260670 RepID=A0AA40APX4_9PEZI|nr:hypothetical protein B0H67DRAFT_552121 [Lasiosphaeris hirsuta]